MSIIDETRSSYNNAEARNDWEAEHATDELEVDVIAKVQVGKWIIEIRDHICRDERESWYEVEAINTKDPTDKLYENDLLVVCNQIAMEYGHCPIKLAKNLIDQASEAYAKYEAKAKAKAKGKVAA